MIPKGDHYWLINAHIPVCLMPDSTLKAETREGLALVDLEIHNGVIKSLKKATAEIPTLPYWDLQKRLVFPGFVDIHTHLDKGHIWERSPNELGTFDQALKAVVADAEKYYQAEDVYQRFEFGLKCSYAHGTTAIRTHIDAAGQQGKIGFEVFQALKKAWQNRLALQAVCLVRIDYYQTSVGLALADKMAEIGTILGGVAFQNPQLETQLDHLFEVAKARNLDLDLHVDETGDPTSQVLHQVALTALKVGFTGQIICGHCCSLGMQTLDQVRETLKLVKESNIGIISLPMCNLYLQSRHDHHLPAWRGITKVHQIKESNIPLAFASDNCRDPFFAFGDHDGLEILSQAVRIAHLDTPYQNWVNTVTQTPADLMGLPNLGRIKPGIDADLIIFKARYFSELFSRSQSDRLVLRKGMQIDSSLPDYSELDHLVFRRA
ncbi:MAG: cytosine deaminase [Microcystaceae cyanobacterium]